MALRQCVNRSGRITRVADWASGHWTPSRAAAYQAQAATDPYQQALQICHFRRPRGRGDWRSGRGRLSRSRFNPRPARAGGATAYAKSIARDRFVSIRAPPARAGRQHSVGTEPIRSTVSIRAPPARAGRPAGFDAGSGSGAVSIRAPPARAGRPQGPTRVPRQHSFNPRPARAVGATFTFYHSGLWCFRFNPRPARAGGATSSDCCPSHHAHCFNPRPARAGGATYGTPDTSRTPP